MRQQVTAQEMLQKMPCLQPLSSCRSPWGSSCSSLEEAAKGWWEKKIKKEKKQKKAEAKAKLKAEKKSKRAKKDSKKADLEEQRASRQVPGQEKEPRLTWGMLRAQEQAARRDQQLVQEMPDELDKEMESSRQEVRSPDRAGSSTSLHELVEQQRKESWGPGNEAMTEKMTAREVLNMQNTPRPLQLSSSDSLSDSDQEALEQKPAKVGSQEPTAVQEMSAASSPSSKTPLQSPELWEEPGKEESQARSQLGEAGREKSSSPAMSQRSKTGKEQSQASRQQQQPGAATPQARKQKAQKPRSSPGKKLRKCLAQIWLCLKCCFCSCFCPCLLHRAQKRNRLP
ncbi:golgin subfamily A member 6-like protein 7 [Melanerpes formicivorus]|uniref:golgin subfamily A member 6-like protein 7 n=1 Tax=Melanerpes formicivorus TaxID=211600 RepID=UPI00358E0460